MMFLFRGAENVDGNKFDLRLVHLYLEKRLPIS